jgi:uncharacterized protein (DUF362 family)
MVEHLKKDRREFIKKSMSMGLAVGGSLLLGKPSLLWSKSEISNMPDLVMVNNGEPDALFNKAIQAMGGMQQFVKRGQSVVVKPNIAWAQKPEIGATTNPLLVKTIIKQCFQAGAKKVYVFDTIFGGPKKYSHCYKISGIEHAATSAGAVMIPSDDEKYYQKVQIPNAKMLKSTSVHEILLESDVFINVPILKDHDLTDLTISMKNLMGIVWDRRFYHLNDVDQCIADFCIFKKPDLNIVDAYRVMMNHGPSGLSMAGYQPRDTFTKKTLLISTDIVAADAGAAKVFGYRPDRIRHIKFGHEMKIGNMNLNELNVQTYTL